jgi:hypothetical protein
MISTIVELTDRFNWGKFLVARFDEQEWARRSLVDGQPLLSGQCGWTTQHILVLDLQTGEGAMFRPSGLASADLEKHRVWVCPMFEVFLGWLYDHPEHWADILTLPPLIELDPEKTRGHNAIYGHRRAGPPQEVIDQKARETKLPQRKDSVEPAASRTFAELALEDVEQMLADPVIQKALLLRLARERFGAATGSLAKLRRADLVEHIETFIRNERART